MAGVHVGAVAAFAWFSWSGFFTMLALYVVTGLGITVGYHRLLSHRAFQTTPWVTRVFATLGALSLQGGPLRWVADHRQHHFHSDSEGDPHDIKRGFFFAHMGWLFYVLPKQHDDRRIRARTRDLNQDPYLVWLEEHDFLPGARRRRPAPAAGRHIAVSVGFLFSAGAALPLHLAGQLSLPHVGLSLRTNSPRVPTTGWSRCSPLARDGTTTTMPGPPPRARD